MIFTLKLSLLIYFITIIITVLVFRKKYDINLVSYLIYICGLNLKEKDEEDLLKSLEDGEGELSDAKGMRRSSLEIPSTSVRYVFLMIITLSLPGILFFRVKPDKD